MKCFLLSFIFLTTQKLHAANDIVFITELTGDQLEENIKITVDGKLVCELKAKAAFFGIGGSDKCSFQPTKKVHKYSITGTLKKEGEEKLTQGKGEGLIINYYQEYQKLNSAKNIDELFEFYNQGIMAINKEAPKDSQINKMTFSATEQKEHIEKYMQDNGVALPKQYIKMLSKYGYPKVKEYVKFIKLGQQKSIADLYLDDYDYPKEYVNKHKGVEKNKGFYRDNDVYYVFHDHTKDFCDGEPMIDYTIMTEGDYYPIETKDLDKAKRCGNFFRFLKEQMIDIFAGTINSSFGDYYVLPVFKNNSLKADLSYNWDGDFSYEYYFEYNDIFY